SASASPAVASDHKTLACPNKRKNLAPAKPDPRGEARSGTCLTSGVWKPARNLSPPPGGTQPARDNGPIGDSACGTGSDIQRCPQPNELGIGDTMHASCSARIQQRL